jgi:hypothetical protein
MAKEWFNSTLATIKSSCMPITSLTVYTEDMIDTLAIKSRTTGLIAAPLMGMPQAN